MNLTIKSKLPFISAEISYHGLSVNIDNVLIDTGSSSTIFAADMVEKIGIMFSDDDIPISIKGVGGVELVYNRCLDFIKVGNRIISDFEIEIGGMNYGFDLNGIIGMDFLLKTNAIIDLQRKRLSFA